MKILEIIKEQVLQEEQAKSVTLTPKQMEQLLAYIRENGNNPKGFWAGFDKFALANSIEFGEGEVLFLARAGLIVGIIQTLGVVAICATAYMKLSVVAQAYETNKNPKTGGPFDLAQFKALRAYYLETYFIAIVVPIIAEALMTFAVRNKISTYILDIIFSPSKRLKGWASILGFVTRKAVSLWLMYWLTTPEAAKWLASSVIAPFLDPMNPGSLGAWIDKAVDYLYTLFIGSSYYEQEVAHKKEKTSVDDTELLDPMAMGKTGKWAGTPSGSNDVQYNAVVGKDPSTGKSVLGVSDPNTGKFIPNKD
jgi:hypothetical protein